MREAIILAGGLGTRLRSAVPDLPKCMAPVAGRPFIAHVIEYLKEQGIDAFIFSLGYKHNVVTDYLNTAFNDLSYTSVVENSPLGTGGAIVAASSMCVDDTVLVVNGDTLFKVNVPKMSAFHAGRKGAATLSLKPMRDFDRYGAVELGEDGSIVRFQEKRAFREGLINGGVYAVSIPDLLSEALPESFSFEKEYLEPRAGKGSLSGWVEDAYFIDIGIPEDYNRAQIELM
jgi:D-glycero-alpha-D-manno-heptose 1-phosphate guanylyltransferase